VARTRTKKKDELEELEDLEDLEEDDEEEVVDEADTDEDEDEDTDEEIDDEEDEEEDVAPKSKKSRASKKRKRDDGKIGSAELAEALGTNGRELRVMLRQKGVEKNENNRYEWDSVEEAVEEMGFKSVKSAKAGLAESRQQRLTELKDKVAASKDKKKAKAKPKSSKKAPVEDDEDEEDDE